MTFLNLPINPFFVKYVKTSKNLLAKYYQEDYQDCKKKLVKDIKIFLKKKEKKGDNMVVNVTRNSHEKFSIFRRSLLKCKGNFFNLRGTDFHFLKHKKYFQSDFVFIFWARKVRSSNKRSFLKMLYFPNYKKNFFWENIRKFFKLLRLGSFIPRNIRNFFIAGFFR